jgi:hypothetical protein
VRLYKLSDYTRPLADAHGVIGYGQSFNYDFITGVLKKNIDEKWLALP